MTIWEKIIVGTGRTSTKALRLKCHRKSWKVRMAGAESREVSGGGRGQRISQASVVTDGGFFSKERRPVRKH